MLRSIGAKCSFASLAMWCLATVAAAQDYPQRPIQVIVPYSAGGPSDAIARVISKSASEIIGQPILISNRGGAGGLLGADAGAKASPDGYTAVMLSPGQVGIALATRKTVPYDPVKDFVPVIQLVEDTLILCVSNGLPVSNMAGLIAYLKAHPGQLNYSSAGAGSMTNMAMELFKRSVGTDIVHVPYKNSTEGMMAVLSGEVSLAFASPSGIKPFLEGGKLKPLAIASAHRSTVVPDVPTMAEMGFADLDAPLWYILAVPKGTPTAAIRKLHDAYAEALKTREVREGLATLGVEIVGAGPEAVGHLIQADIARWSGVAKSGDISLQ
jgi:tripartite-type tricarboxylate transporter receptor subunit TctC